MDRSVRVNVPCEKLSDCPKRLYGNLRVANSNFDGTIVVALIVDTFKNVFLNPVGRSHQVNDTLLIGRVFMG